MITSPLHFLNINPATRTRPRRPLNHSSHGRFFNSQAACILAVEFLACEPRVPGPLMDVAHLVAAGVAQHQLLAGSVNLSGVAAFAEAPAEIEDLLHGTAG